MPRGALCKGGDGRDEMRVLVQALTAAPGGSINVLATLLRSWSSDDEIVCLAWRPQMVTTLRETGHEVLAIEANSTPAAMWRTMISHRRAVERWRPDIIFSQQYLLPGMSVPQAVHHRNLLRFEPIESPSLKARGRDAAVVETLRRSTISIFNSYALRDAAVRRWPHLDVNRAAVLHNPVDVEDFEQATHRRDPRKVRILVPQSDMHHKRNDLAVEVLYRLIRHLRAQGDPRQAEMTFVGTGGYAQVRDAADHLGLRDYIRLPGYLARPDLAAVYHESDVALITSCKESFCNPIVEAHAAGLPIVTTPLPIFGEVWGPLSMTAGDHSTEALMSRLIEAVDRCPVGSAKLAAAKHFAKSFSGEDKARELRNTLALVTATPRT